jgi:hypothetical protein
MVIKRTNLIRSQSYHSSETQLSTAAAGSAAPQMQQQPPVVDPQVGSERVITESDIKAYHQDRRQRRHRNDKLELPGGLPTTVTSLFASSEGAKSPSPKLPPARYRQRRTQALQLQTTDVVQGLAADLPMLPVPAPLNPPRQDGRRPSGLKLAIPLPAPSTGVARVDATVGAVPSPAKVYTNRNKRMFNAHYTAANARRPPFVGSDSKGQFRTVDYPFRRIPRAPGDSSEDLADMSKLVSSFDGVAGRKKARRLEGMVLDG